jgi:hypothetical protein
MMTAQVIDLGYRRRGWRLVIAQCQSCHARDVVMQQQDCPLDHCECPDCGAFAWGVTHVKRDGKFVPRMEALS